MTVMQGFHDHMQDHIRIISSTGSVLNKCRQCLVLQKKTQTFLPEEPPSSSKVTGEAAAASVLEGGGEGATGSGAAQEKKSIQNKHMNDLNSLLHMYRGRPCRGSNPGCWRANAPLLPLGQI
jgi:hypothetical protein